jgi:hypothetical protein
VGEAVTEVHFVESILAKFRFDTVESFLMENGFSMQASLFKVRQINIAITLSVISLKPIYSPSTT